MRRRSNSESRYQASDAESSAEGPYDAVRLAWEGSKVVKRLRSDVAKLKRCPTGREACTSWMILMWTLGRRTSEIIEVAHQCGWRVDDDEDTRLDAIERSHVNAYREAGLRRPRPSVESSAELSARREATARNARRILRDFRQNKTGGLT